MNSYKHIGLILALIAYFSTAFAQILDPVQWSFEWRKLSEKEFEIQFHAEIEDKWHLYTQTVPEDGPIPTSFTFEKHEGFEFVGDVKESESITAYEEVLGDTLSFFTEKATFTQSVRKTGNANLISGFLEFMVCDDKKCLPPEMIDFTFDLNQKEAEKSTESNIENNTAAISGEEPGMYNPVDWSFEVIREDDEYVFVVKATIEEGWHVYARELDSDEGPIPTSIEFSGSENIEFLGEIQDVGEVHTEYDPNFMMDLSYFEKEVEFRRKLKLTGKGASVAGTLEFMVCDAEKCLPPETIEFDIDIEPSEGLKDAESEGDGKSISFWATFLKGFFGGFIALLTPCVFPMIPLTVSFFTKQSKTRTKGITNAILYGISIILIYVLLGYGVTSIFGADALNALSTNVWFNLAFFVLLVVFAISFFGAFEITLPNSWVNKADSASDKGGLIGIFFMAFTLSLVSFSCTGPIIGTLLVDAAVNGGVAGPLVGMFGFSLALAMPFGLFAAFPGWLNSLPSSGGWLNSVKVVLGFLELAFAFKFLSNADLVVQAGLLKRELFIAIWIAIFALLTAYLLGFFRLPHDNEVNKISVTRMLTAALSLMFTIYLIPGIWGAPLKIISGFPPPMFYSESPNGLGGSRIVSGTDGEEVVGDPAHCPHGLNCFHKYDEGLAYARKVNKPVLLDFTGWACVNCRKMEEQVWSDPKVLDLLRNEVVLISLYVDEKLDLPEKEQIEVEIGEKTKKLRTVGNKWSYFQANRYNTNSQPYYVIIDHDENTLNGSAAYDPDIKKFYNWLLEGIQKFKKETKG